MTARGSLVAVLLVSGALAAWFGGCGGDSESGTSATGGSKACVPGDSKSCACSDGRTGAQVCAADGSAFGDCSCTGGPAGSGGSPASSTGPVGSGGVGIGGTGGSGGVGANGAGGQGGAVLQCYFYPDCDQALAAQCLCLGCGDMVTCSDATTDCVCPQCKTTPQCGNMCADDGKCDPYLEGCSCSDCADHPLCK